MLSKKYESHKPSSHLAVITEVKAYFYSIPFIRPLTLKGRSYQNRKGILLSCTFGKRTVWGEAAPLPGFSSDSINECKKVAPALAKELKGITHSEQIEALLTSTDIPASLRFALEMILIDSGQPSLIPLELRKISEQRKAVDVNALCVSGVCDPAKRVNQLARQGFKTIKIKVGQQKLEQDIAFVRTLLATRKKGMTLRLDANRAWGLRDALSFSQAVAAPSLEYIEEPLKDPGRLKDFMASSKIPVALDESLLELSPSELVELKGIKAFILKPTILGGFLRSLEFAKIATKLKAYPVVTSSFESAIAISALARFASYIAHKKAHGFDTLSYLAHDLSGNKISIKNGKVVMKNSLASLAPLRRYIEPL